MYKLLKTRSSGYIPEAHNVRLRTQSGAWNNISKVGIISPTPYSSYTESMSEDMMVNFLFSGIVDDTFVISAQQSAGTDWAAVPYQIYTGDNVETMTGITNITGTATLTVKGPNQTIAPHWQYLRRVEFPEPVTGSAEAKINWGNNATVKVNTVADNVYWIAEDATAHTPPYITAFTQEELDNLYTYGLDFPNGSDSNNILMQYNTMPQSFTVNLKPTNTAKNNTELDYKLYTGNDSEIYHGEIHYSRVDANWGSWSAFTTDFYDDLPSPSAYGLYKASGWPMPEPVPPTPSYHVYLIDTTTHTGSTKWALNFDKAIDMPYIRLYITAYIPSVSDLAVCNNVTGDWDNGMMIRLRSHNGLNWGFATDSVNNSLSNYTRITEVGSGSIIIKDGVRYHQTNLSTSSYHNIKLIFDRVNNKGYFYADETLYGTFDCNVDIGGLMNSLSLLQETKSPSCTYTSVIGFNSLQDAQDYTEQ